MEKNPSNPWNVSDRDFPETGSIEEQLRFLLNYAVLAPSKHNTQPWLFHVHQNTIELYADESRVLSMVDAKGREMIMSCGAALANLLAALRYFGFSWTMEIPSKPGAHNLLAELTIEKGVVATGEERKRFFAILQRRTNRRAFTPRPVPAAVLSKLEEVAGQAGTYLYVIQNEEQRAELANLILAADRTLWADQQFRHEMASWVHTNESNSPDGIPAYALGKADTTSYLGPLMLRTLVDHSEGQQSKNTPTLAILSTVADTWYDWLSAGLALENILLEARLFGVWASFFSQPTEVPVPRQALRKLIERSDFPQIVLRLGYAARVQPTPRRDVDDVLK